MSSCESTVEKTQSSNDTGINAVPAEILQQILQQVILGTSPFLDVDLKDGPMWTMRKVCRYWRNLTSNEPYMWSRWGISSQIDVHPDLKHEIHPEILKGRIQLCLKNSKQLPLFLFLHIHAHDNLYRGVVCELIAEGAFTRRHIHSISLTEFTPLAYHISKTASKEGIFYRLFEQQILDKEILGLPFMQTKKLSLHDSRIDGSVLQMMPQLEELTCFNTDISPTTAVLTLPSLHTLHIAAGDEYQLEIFGILYTPLLTNIRLKFHVKDELRGSTALRMFQQLQKRTQCTIKHLQLIGVAEETMEEVQHFMDVDILSLRDILQSTKVLSTLDSTYFLPSLKTLEVGAEIGFGLPKALMEVMRRRSGSLRNVRCIAEVRPPEEPKKWQAFCNGSFAKIRELGDELGIDVDTMVMNFDRNEKIYDTRREVDHSRTSVR